MAKCKMVHIGIFFDGTGNNKANDKESGSQSNIAKLSDLYIHGQKISNYSNEQCDHYGHMIYKDGVGTTAGKRDYLKDKTDKGAGGGGAKRINEAIEELAELLNDEGKYPALLVENGSGYRERIIDVFGFSRGAAMARDFINTFYKRNRKEFGLKKVRINFVGLYDTVGSFGEAGNNINFKPKEKKTSKGDVVLGVVSPAASYVKRNMYDTEAKYVLSDKGVENDSNFEPYNFVLAHNSAEKIVHMIASDEVRKNFPLSSIMPIGGSHVEWTYGGVHSDIGGGYAPRVVERHQIDLGEFPNFAQAQAVEKKTKPTLTSDWSFTKIPNTTQFLTPLKDRTHYVTAKFNRIVTNDISAITLHRMYEEAIQHKVPFKPISIPMPDSMKEYNTHTKANPDDATSFKGMQELRVKYFHHSAVDQGENDTHYDGNTSIKEVLLDDSPDTIGGNDTRYVRTKSGKTITEREIYPNKGRPIPPTKF